jgi:hypothetical protein
MDNFFLLLTIFTERGGKVISISALNRVVPCSKLVPDILTEVFRNLSKSLQAYNLLSSALTFPYDTIAHI